MSGPATYAAKIASGATGGAETLNSNYPVRGVNGGDAWFFSFFYEATRVTGTEVTTIQATADWYNTSGTLISSTNSTVVSLNATVGWTCVESKHIAPAGAVSAKVRYTFTPGASGTFQHDIYLTATRFAKTQIGATLGADWAANLLNRPANLAALTGSEAINNQAILNSIAADNVLSKTEKLNSLSKLYADLEARYVDLKNRAAALSLSTTNLDNARSAWQTLLNSYAPAWNDGSQDTSIFATAFPDQNFPAGWSGSAIQAVNGIYTTLTDNSSTVYMDTTRQTPIAGVQNKWVSGSGYLFAAGIIVKKDTTPWATRAMTLRCTTYTSGGSYSVIGDIILDTSTGQISTSGTPSDYGVLDLGAEWFVYACIQSAAGDANVGIEIYPAVGQSGAYNVSDTGSVDVRSAVLTNGGWGQLGRSMLVGKLAAYSKQLTLLATSISTTDSQLSNYVDGPTIANVQYDSTGTTLQSTVDLNFYLRSGTGGAIVTSGVTMSYTVISGNVNGFGPSNGAQTLTVGGNGVGDLSVTSMSSDTAQIKISVVYGGITRTYFCSLTKQLAAAASGSGSGGSGTSASQTSGFTSITSAYGTWTVISNTLNFTTGASQTSINVVINLNPRMAKTADQSGPWNVQYKVQRLISGTWTDQGSVQNSNPDPYNDTIDTIVTSNAGSVSATVVVTGGTPPIAGNTAYSFRVLCCLSPVDNTTTYAYPTNGAALIQGVPSGGGVSIS